MNLGEILVANGASLLLLIILLICRHMTRRNRRTGDRVLTAIICIGIAGTFLEPFTFLIDGKSGLFIRIVSFFTNSVEYACSATAALLWVWYVDLSLYRDEKRLKRYLPLSVFWSVLILMLLGNLFGEFLFSIGADNVYARQPLGYIFYVFFITAYVASIIIYYRFRAVHGEAQFFPIWMFIVPLFLAILIQVPFYGISVSYLGCSIGLIGLHMNMQSKMSLVDSLTGLYNRAYIEHAMIVARQNSRRFTYSGIMLDLDRFKQINDTLGHSVGDDALTDAARLLLNATDRDSLAFRFAGDEFIVLVKTAAGRAEELEAKTVAVEQRILAESEKFNRESHAPYRIVFSMGHSLFDAKRTDDEFFREMDEEMYKDKQRHKEQERQALAEANTKA